MKKILFSALVSGGMAFGAATAVMADEAKDDGGVTCLNVSRIQHSKIVDNETIILHMRGGPDYEMKLAHRCSGLKIQGTWFHDAKGLAKLCSIDFIKVPITTSGNVLNTPTKSCNIASITPIAEKPEDAKGS